MKHIKKIAAMIFILTLMLVMMIAPMAYAAPLGDSTNPPDALSVILNSGLLAVLLALAVSGIKYGCAWLDAHAKAISANMKNSTIADAFYKMEHAVSAAVAQTAQQEADQLKADAAATGGKLTDDQKTQLLNLAKDRATQLVSQDVLDIVMQNVSDFDAWIQAQIETAVRAGKQG